jgi:hypothetical protein
VISHLLGLDLAIYRETRWRAVEVLAGSRPCPPSDGLETA